MDCSICHRGHDPQRLPFLCAVDSRNQVYDGRLKNLHLLIENDSLQAQIARAAGDASGSAQLALSQRRLAEDRTDQILAAADKLRAEIQAARDEIKARRAALARRRSDLASVSTGLADRRARQQHDVERSTQMLRFRWSQGAEDMSRTRAFLCTEALRLYGLKRTRKSNTSRYDYHIGKVPIVDLTSMDSLTPEVISTSLAHVAHIVMLVSHYLAVRLPAEITLPHRDYPRPTIFNLPSSYQHGPVSFPSASSSTLVSSSTQARDPDSHHVPRPRPLFVDKPLPQLSKEDPAMYSFFLEGVTLLAYNIAWLCSCQGVSIGDKGSFEDMCHMGRNLYNFVLASQLQGYVQPSKPENNVSHAEDGNTVESRSNWIGRYSHGTTYYYLSGVEGTDFIRTFKLPNPMKLADKLKKKLLGDAPGADWEVLDDDAWKPDDGPNGDAAAKALADKKGLEGKGSPRPGTNGWTKVKHRS
ncbi:UV radiation resistance protein/autophagy-related protein 14 [Purpureocillium lavendulum]|uniref:Autophagy-related protein 14 n=1 Tax=Purpureocillium lavendulum TaxID=1247861 RepID=A0AB34FU49_9HYPO|nr:UV radiation resistance protein/autophagy-related protein 14 [Purpureocillium lavendulum]